MDPAKMLSREFRAKALSRRAGLAGVVVVGLPYLLAPMDSPSEAPAADPAQRARAWALEQWPCFSVSTDADFAP